MISRTCVIALLTVFALLVNGSKRGIQDSVLLQRLAASSRRWFYDFPR